MVNKIIAVIEIDSTDLDYAENSSCRTCSGLGNKLV